jgi:hypothetical protein
MSEYKHEIGSRVEHFSNRRKGTVTNQCIGINWCYVLWDGDKDVKMTHNHSLKKIEEKENKVNAQGLNARELLKIGDRVVANNGEKGTVTSNELIGSTRVHVQWDNVSGDYLDAVLISGLRKDTEGFKKGQTVQIIGVFGTGTVVEDSTEFRTLVDWGKGGQPQATVTSNLRLVREAPKMQDAITLLEAELEKKKAVRDEADAEIRNIKKAMDLLKGLG